MKPLLKICIIIYLGIGILFSFAGVATHFILGKTSEGPRYDHVYQINDAYIGTNKHLYVCVDGSYDNKDQQYWIMVPVYHIEHMPEKLDAVEGYSGYWKTSFQQLWNLPRENIRVTGCQQRPNDALRTVAITTLDAGMWDSFKTEDIFNEHFSLSAETELVYQLHVTDGAGKPISHRDMAYANIDSQFGDQHAMAFKTNYHNERGTVLWYLVLPLAWMFDVLIWPVELYMWIQYAGAH